MVILGDHNRCFCTIWREYFHKLSKDDLLARVQKNNFTTPNVPPRKRRYFWPFWSVLYFFTLEATKACLPHQNQSSSNQLLSGVTSRVSKQPWEPSLRRRKLRLKWRNREKSNKTQIMHLHWVRTKKNQARFWLGIKLYTMNQILGQNAVKVKFLFF